MADRMISASEFKQRCLALLDRVSTSNDTFIVTKRGKPVARLTALEEGTRPDVRGLEGSVTYLTDDEDLLFSTGEVWNADRGEFP